VGRVTHELVVQPEALSSAEITRTVLKRLNSYITGAWWVAKGYPSSGLPNLIQDEYGIRGAGMAALGLAVGWDLATSEIAVTRAVQLSCAAAAQHKATKGSTGWGDGWQTAYWAALNGLAASLVWRQLSTAQRESVAVMVEHEADRLLGETIPVWTLANGTVVTPGDSKHEENEWNSTCLVLAAAMMPTHAHAADWIRKAVAYVMSGAAHEDDLADLTMVNGQTAAEWTSAGWNLNADYTVTNHGRVHPDYMQTVTLGLQSAVTSAVFGQDSPVGLAWNASRVYRALQAAEFNGRTMYEVGSPLVHYPQGGDWGTRRPAGYACLDAMVSALGLDPWGEPGVQRPAAYWERLHLVDCATMQNRPATGSHPSGILASTTPNNGEDHYRSRVEWTAGHLGLALLARQVTVTWHDEAV
jgi:hypothetical protein